MENTVEGYYTNTRPEVVELVPKSSRFVVDVGCGAGGLGHALKQSIPGVQVRGVEPVASQAELARRVLDDVLLGNAEDPLPADWPRPDCIILADVLEHLVEPWTVLRGYRELIQPGGTCVASIPNVANREILLGLLNHRWDYAEHGLLDRTHLRFFTRETAIELFEGAGFTIQGVHRVLQIGRSPIGKWLRRNINKEVGRDRIYPSPIAQLIDGYTFQFLLVAS
jgi:O-antigen biosynthesis protein